MMYKYRGTKTGAADPWNPKAKKPRQARKPQTLKPCGTYAAYKRHTRNGEVPCRECLDALADYMAKLRGTESSGRRRAGSPLCGTYSGYVKHYRRHESPCNECRAAHSEYKKLYRARKAAA